MANTFPPRRGSVSASRWPSATWAIRSTPSLDKADKAGCAIIVPVDGVVAWHFEANAPHQTYGLDLMDPDGMIPRCRRPVGRADQGRDRRSGDAGGTGRWGVRNHAVRRRHGRNRQICRGAHQGGKLVSVAGGGDTVSALAHAGVKDSLTLCVDGGRRLPRVDGRQRCCRASRRWRSRRRDDRRWTLRRGCNLAEILRDRRSVLAIRRA